MTSLFTSIGFNLDFPEFSGPPGVLDFEPYHSNSEDESKLEDDTPPPPPKRVKRKRAPKTIVEPSKRLLPALPTPPTPQPAKRPPLRLPPRKLTEEERRKEQRLKAIENERKRLQCPANLERAAREAERSQKVLKVRKRKRDE